MDPALSRRVLIAAFVSVLSNGCSAGPSPSAPPDDPVAAPPPNAVPTPTSAIAPHPPESASPFAAVEREVGGRVGVYALDTGSGEHLGHRQDERFALCSTFKWALAAAVLAKVDAGELSLDRRVDYGPADLLDYAPVTRKRVESGGMTIEALAEAAVTVSDNTAANLLLDRIDGPPGLTRFLRDAGDTVTRLDRTEPELNTNTPGDERDTTSPAAMVGAMKAILLGSVLAPASRDRLLGWLIASTTGAERLRAGLPVGWRAGDKTGTCGPGAANDMAIVWPPGGAPILVAAYMTGGSKSMEEMNAAHADVARIIADRLGPQR